MEPAEALSAFVAVVLVFAPVVLLGWVGRLGSLALAENAAWLDSPRTTSTNV